MADIETRTALRDLITERSLLNVFEEWTDDKVDGSEDRFYKKISQEVTSECRSWNVGLPLGGQAQQFSSNGGVGGNYSRGML